MSSPLSRSQCDFIRRWYPLGYAIDVLALAVSARAERVRAYIIVSAALKLRSTSPPQASLPPLPKFRGTPDKCGSPHQQTPTLTPAQQTYIVINYARGWGIEPIGERLPGIGYKTIRAHLLKSGIAIRSGGGYAKMATDLPPPPGSTSKLVSKPRSDKPKKSRPQAAPDPKLLAWNQPIRPGWRVHGECVEPQRRARF